MIAAYRACHCLYPVAWINGRTRERRSALPALVSDALLRKSERTRGRQYRNYLWVK